MLINKVIFYICLIVVTLATMILLVGCSNINTKEVEADAAIVIEEAKKVNYTEEIKAISECENGNYVACIEDFIMGLSGL